MDAKTVDDIRRLREWLMRLTGKDWWVRRIGGEYLAYFEGAKLHAETIEEAQDPDKWLHALQCWGWIRDTKESRAAPD